ncbi:hypothetical protein GCM10028805_47260 [Spirosoma harenae]
MKTTLERVAEFHEMTNCPVLLVPALPEDRIALRINLLQEELNELQQAAQEGDLVGVADALTDLQYVLDGSYLEFGMTEIKETLFDEVHRSNMSKSCVSMVQAYESAEHHRESGTDCKIEDRGSCFVIVRNSDGKILKPIGYSKAELTPIVFPVDNF